MDNSARNRVSENSGHSPENLVTKKRQEDLKDTKEIRDASEVGKAAFVEAVGLDESVETTGRVSEVLSKTKESDGGGASAKAGSGSTKFDPNEIKQRLLSNLPEEKVMRAQIEKEIKKEINYLHKKAMKMLSRPGEVNYFEMNNMLRKIRELKGILLALVKASVEGLKSLWLRYVHGVM